MFFKSILTLKFKNGYCKDRTNRQKVLRWKQNFTTSLKPEFLPPWEHKIKDAFCPKPDILYETLNNKQQNSSDSSLEYSSRSHGLETFCIWVDVFISFSFLSPDVCCVHLMPSHSFRFLPWVRVKEGFLFTFSTSVIQRFNISIQNSEVFMV